MHFQQIYRKDTHEYQRFWIWLTVNAVQSWEVWSCREGKVYRWRWSSNYIMTSACYTCNICMQTAIIITASQCRVHVAPFSISRVHFVNQMLNLVDESRPTHYFLSVLYVTLSGDAYRKPPDPLIIFSSAVIRTERCWSMMWCVEALSEILYGPSDEMSDEERSIPIQIILSLTMDKWVYTSSFCCISNVWPLWRSPCTPCDILQKIWLRFPWLPTWFLFKVFKGSWKNMREFIHDYIMMVRLVFSNVMIWCHPLMSESKSYHSWVNRNLTTWSSPHDAKPSMHSEFCPVRSIGQTSVCLLFYSMQIQAILMPTSLAMSDHSDLHIQVFLTWAVLR